MILPTKENSMMDMAEGSFEWGVDFNEIKRFFQPSFLKHDFDAQLGVLGCGNSNLSLELYKSGYVNIVNVDNRQDVIDIMRQRCKEEMPLMTWLCADALSCHEELESGGFDVLIDKSLFDWFLADDYNGMHPYFMEIHRLLNARKNAAFVLVSFHKRDYLLKLLPIELLKFDSLDSFCLNDEETKVQGCVLIFRKSSQSESELMIDSEAFLLHVKNIINQHFQSEEPMFEIGSESYLSLREHFTREMETTNCDNNLGVPIEKAYDLIISSDLKSEYPFQDFLLDVNRTIPKWKDKAKKANDGEASSFMTFEEACLFMKINQ